MAERIIGIIAGQGVYPETFARAARASEPGVKLVAAAFTDETAESFSDEVDEMAWFRVGQVGKVIKYFKKMGVTEAVMIGQIAPSNLFNLRPDMRAVVMIARLKERNAETLFGGIADELQKDGITVLPATTFLEDLLPAAGRVGGPALKRRDEEDAEYGFGIAKASSKLDIGQSVVVRRGTVLAVEAFEGTNNCIRRGGELGRGKHVTLAKVSKPNQDFRFDVPVIGPQTIQVCADAGVSTIVVEAGRTLLLEKDEILRLCDTLKVSLHALNSDEL